MSLKGCTESDFRCLASKGLAPEDCVFMSLISEKKEERRKKLNHKIMVQKAKKVKGVPEVLVWPSG